MKLKVAPHSGLVVGSDQTEVPFHESPEAQLIGCAPALRCLTRGILLQHDP